MTFFLFTLGLLLLIGGAELLVRGSTRVATIAGISPLVVGLTVVAFGTSAPELAVTTAATLRGDADLALGNVVGSNVLNVLLILGISAAVAPLLVQKRLVRLEVPFMILVSAVVVLLALDRSISRLEGLFLLAAGITYTVVLVIQARRAGNAPTEDAPVGGAGTPAGDAPAGDTAPGGTAPGGPREGGAGAGASPPGRTPLAVLGHVAMAAAGLALLVLGSRWIVQGAKAMAETFGVPDLVIGLTIVSVGTSLPELATSVVASLRGERDIAVGNIIGSNIFNLLIILGTAAAVAPEGIAVALTALTFDLPVMLAVSVACLPIFFTGFRIDRLEGLIFLAFYVAYTAYLALDAANHQALPQLREGILFFGLPLTGVVLLLAGLRRRSERPSP